MANTPWQDRGTQEIISPHINAVQYAIKNVEQSLNMQTTAKTDQPLTLIEDTNGLYRIAQAEDKNWLTDPAPVIQKLIDGVWTTITTGFTIEYAGGAVLFDTDQAGNQFRASFTHITNQSGFNTHLSDTAPHSNYVAQLGATNQIVNLFKALNQQIDTRSATLTYDDNGRLTAVTQEDGATTVKTTSLDYNANDNLTTVTEQVAGKTITITLTYNASGNLTSVTRSVA